VPYDNLSNGIVMLDASFIGRKEMRFLRHVCGHVDAGAMDENFSSLVKYSVYTNTNKRSKPFLESYSSYEVDLAVVHNARNEILKSKCKFSEIRPCAGAAVRKTK
jgi:hypothetical protein